MSEEGPIFQEQMRRFGREHKQGEHVLISGSTGSGKTKLTRRLIQPRLDRGGHVIVFVAKHNADKTFTEDYSDFTVWRDYRKRPPSWQNKVLLWPDVSKFKGNKTRILEHQKEVFTDAIEDINDKGRRTVVVDEGLYMCSPSFLSMADEIAMMHAIGRSNDLTMFDLMQRPSNMPLILYGSASHAFVGRTREESDKKRLAEMGARESSRELAAMIAANERHDFTWVPVTPDWPAECVNLRR